jgi:hypothetical protein
VLSFTFVPQRAADYSLRFVDVSDIPNSRSDFVYFETVVLQYIEERGTISNTHVSLRAKNEMWSVMTMTLCAVAICILRSSQQLFQSVCQILVFRNINEKVIGDDHIEWSLVGGKGRSPRVRNMLKRN